MVHGFNVAVVKGGRAFPRNFGLVRMRQIDSPSNHVIDRLRRPRANDIAKFLDIFLPFFAKSFQNVFLICTKFLLNFY